MTRLRETEIDRLIQLANKTLSGKSTGELVTDNELKNIGNAMMELRLLRELEDACFQMESATLLVAVCRKCMKHATACIDHSGLRERSILRWEKALAACKENKRE